MAHVNDVTALRLERLCFSKAWGLVWGETAAVDEDGAVMPDATLRAYYGMMRWRARIGHDAQISLSEMRISTGMAVLSKPT